MKQGEHLLMPGQPRYVVVGGPQREPLTPGTTNSRLQSSRGAGPKGPLKIGPEGIFLSIYKSKASISLALSRAAAGLRVFERLTMGGTGGFGAGPATLNCDNHRLPNPDDGAPQAGSCATDTYHQHRAGPGDGQAAEEAF